MRTKISVIILNYKHLDDTVNCINSLLKTDNGERTDILVVDNSPSRDSESILMNAFPRIKYIKSPVNSGFAGGNNQGIKVALASGSTHILIVNPDVTFSHRFFVPLMKHFSDKRVGIVAPAICHIQKNKVMYGLEGRVDWALAKPEHRNLANIRDEKPISSEFVSFACVLISSETFIKAGLLDDGYFMYFEDVDYCIRAGKAGFKTMIDPKVTVSHRTSSSFAHPTQKLSISFRSQLRFIGKWLPFSHRILPYLYALVLYPYLHLLWTYHEMKYRKRNIEIA